jgi:hypothetical protein
VVHCVDTEGPLSESLEQTFQRLEAMFGLRLEPDPELLARIQRREVDLGGCEEAAARALSPQLLRYNADWAAVAGMLRGFWSPAAQDALRDPEGRPWTTTWFCCDHVGYDANPQGRDIGWHRVFDFYDRALAARETASRDEIEFHFHPPPLNGRANSNATHWFANRPTLFQILARRLIDRLWFPAANRPGFHVTRPDSHWFLEQFIPFDFANQAMDRADGGGEQRDVGGGRFGDWRRAPTGWRPYRPHHDDHQRPGACRRWIFRCLNVGTRFRLLTQADVDAAFVQAAREGEAALAFTNHDFRDVRPDCEATMAMIRRAAAAHPGTRWRHSTAREAARAATGAADAGAAPFLRLAVEGGAVAVAADRPIFGPQPFLAILSDDGRYFHDALDWTLEPGRWSYALDAHTLPPDRVAAVAVGAADAAGRVAAARWRRGAGVEVSAR